MRCWACATTPTASPKAWICWRLRRLKQAIADYTEMFRRAGLKLKVALPEQAAYQNLVGGNPRALANCCVIDFSHHMTKLHFFLDGAYDVARVIEIGGIDIDRAIANEYGVDEHVADQYKRTDYQGAQRSEAARAVYQSIAIEIGRALNFYGFNNPDVVIEVAYLLRWRAASGSAGRGGGCPCRLARVVYRRRAAADERAVGRGPSLSGCHRRHHEGGAVAMDLKQEVSLSALKRGKVPAYPVKTSINLVDTQQQRGNLLAQLGLFAIALVLIGVFAKFAVVDPLAASAASSNEVSAAQARLDVLAAENADYAELNAQYDRYVVPGLSEEEQNLVDRDVVLNLLQQKVMGVGHLSSLRMEKNTATVTCLGADLNEVSALVESLESDQRVAHVTVSTAQGENDSSTSATIQIVFAGPLDVEGDGGSKEKGAGDGAA